MTFDETLNELHRLGTEQTRRTYLRHGCGGRVLGVTSLGADLREAQARAYEAVKLISFPGMHYRTDIGHRALAGG